MVYLYRLLSGTAMLSIVCSLYAQAPAPDACGTDVLHQQMYNHDAEYQRTFDQMNERLYRQLLQHQRQAPSSPQRNNNSCDQVLQIPVVVHIMHLPGDQTPDDQTSNLTDARVQAGIAHLNDAFRNRGPYAGGPYYTDAGISSVDVEIEFVLARRAPDGSPTNGIVRVPTAYSNLFKDDPCGNGTEDGCMKALSIWDPTRYMNVWLVNEICETRADNPGSCWIGGYAFYANSHGQPYDGIVNEARFWGASPDDSKLHIHEVGHYLNLFHTFRNEDCANDNCLLDGDRVCDTPPDLNGTIYTSCNSPVPANRTSNSCSTDANDSSPNNPFSTDVQDMYENYMDYGFWVCQNTFTPGQKARMRASLQGIRGSLLQSDGAIPPNSALDVGIERISMPDGFACSSAMTPVLEVKNYGTNTINSLVIGQELNGNLLSSYNWAGSLAPGQSSNIALNTINIPFEGTHTFKAIILDANGIGKDSYSLNDESCDVFDYAPSAILNTLPYCLDFEGSANLPAGWKKENARAASLWKSYEGPLACADAGQRAFYLDTWENSAIEFGSEDAIVSSVIDLSNYSSAELRFDRAYKRAFAPLALTVEVSADCGASFQQLLHLDELSLATAPGFAYSGLWIPGSCDEWQQENINLNDYVGSSIILRFKATYTQSAAFSQRLYLDNLCIDGFSDVVLPCTGPSAIASAVGEYVADTACLDGAGWTHYWKRAATPPATPADVLLLSIKQDGVMQLEPSQVRVGITPAHGNGGHDLSAAPYVSRQDGWYVMGRYYDVSPTVQPAEAVSVRFYYDDTDFQDVQQAVAASPVPGTLDSHTALVFYKISGHNPNPALDQHAGVMPAQFTELFHAGTPSPTAWTYQSLGGYHQAEFQVLSFSGGGGGSNGRGDGGTVFPVELLHFEGVAAQEQIQLSWSTAWELNNDRFVVQRQANGAFISIGEVKGKQNSRELSRYEFTDDAPLLGSNIYRLKQVDLNGSFSYSPAIEVVFSRNKGVYLFPNPSKQQFSVQLEAGEAGELDIRVLSMRGKEVLRKQVHASGGAAISLEWGSIPAGVYVYEIQLNGRMYRGKLIRH